MDKLNLFITYLNSCYQTVVDWYQNLSQLEQDIVKVVIGIVVTGLLTGTYRLLKRRISSPKASIFLNYKQYFDKLEVKNHLQKFKWIAVREQAAENEQKIEHIDILKEIKKQLSAKFHSILILAGAGGCGKTKVLYEFAKKHNQQCVFIRLNFSQLDFIAAQKINQESKKLARSIKYIVLDDVHNNPQTAFSFCLNLHTAGKKIILATRYDDELLAIFKKQPLGTPALLRLRKMENMQDLQQPKRPTWLTPELKQNMIKIAAGIPEVFSITCDHISQKWEENPAANPQNLLRGINNKNDLFFSIRHDIEAKAGTEALPFCAQLAILQGLEKTDPLYEQYFNTCIKQLKNMKIIFDEHNSLFLKPDILSDYIAQHYFFPGNQISPDFKQFIRTTSPQKWLKTVSSLSGYYKESAAPVFRNAARFILLQTKEKQINSEALIQLSLDCFNGFNDFKMVVETIGQFWKLEIDTQNLTLLNRLGIFNHRTSELDTALKWWIRLLKIAETQKDKYWIASTYNNLGLVYHDKGEWDKAIEFYEKSLAGLEKVGDIHGQAKTFNNLGLVYHDKDEWDKAIEFHEKSLAGLEKVGDIHGQALTYGNLGLLYFKQQKQPQAVSLVLTSWFVLSKLGAKAEVRQADGILSDFQKEMGEEEFAKIYAKALNFILEQGINWGQRCVVSKQEAREIRKELNINVIKLRR